MKPTILLAEFLFDGGYEPRYVATAPYYSQSTDSIGVRAYLGRITAEPTFKTTLTCVIWGGTSATSIGAMTLIDTDGELTDWLALATRDSECVLRLTYSGQPYDDSTVLARCIVDEVRKIDGGLQINLRGRDTLLDKPLQSITYDSTAPNAAIEGTPKPVILGHVNQAEPVVYDRTTLEYHLTDSGDLVITAVLSGGSVAVASTGGPLSPQQAQWSDNADHTGFVMNVQPGARVLCDAGGGSAIGDDVVADAAAESRFDVPANWSAGVPIGWTVVTDGLAPYDIVQEPGIGLVFSGDTDIISSRTLTLAGALTVGNWYLLVGKVARNSAGALKLMNNGHVIDSEGEFAVLWRETSSTDVQIRHATAPSALSVTLTYLYVFSIGTLGGSPRDITTMTDMIEHLAIARGGFIPSEIDLATYIANEAVNPEVGYYNQSNLTVREVINRAVDSVTGWSWVGPDGVLRIGRLRIPNPATVPAITASRLNIVGAYPVFTPDAAQGLSDTYAGRRNWTPYSEGELAGITYTDQGPLIADFRVKAKTAATLRRNYRHAVGAPPVTTYSQNEIELQDEADRVGDIYSTRNASTTRAGVPGFWSFSIALPDDFAVADIEVDQLIRLDGTNPFGPNLFGFYHDMNAIIVDASFRARSNIVSLLVWTSP